jgi:hypothetical protein
MTPLSSISGIGKASLELLEAAGFGSAEALAKAGPDELASELERANGILAIAKRAPAKASVRKWIDSARALTGAADEPAPAMKMPVDYENSPSVAAMLADSPFAIPLPAKVLKDRSLAVSDIPPAILLNRYSGDLEVRVEDRLPGPRNGGRPAMPESNVRIAEVATGRLEIDNSRVKPIEALAGRPSRPAATGPVVENDRVALIRAPRAATNKGRDPKSRRYVRGVLHSHPVFLTTGALATLLLFVALPLGIVSAGLLLLSQEVPATFGWVPKWFLAFPLALPVAGLGYLIWGLGGSCRICGQKLFVPRMCLKNSKAHHLSGLGHIVPLCLHILLFRWFRCTYCGTPVRLKK